MVLQWYCRVCQGQTLITLVEFLYKNTCDELHIYFYLIMQRIKHRMSKLV